MNKRMKTIMKRKAQTELLGIVIVVVLVAFGMLFAFKLSSTKAPEAKKTFEEKQLAANMLGAFLRTTSDCNVEKISSLIADCGSIKVISCNGKDSCEYLKDTTKKVFDATLGTWNKNYTFKMYKTTQDIFTVTSGGCTSYQESQTQPFPVYGDIIYIKLDLCQG